MIGLLRLLIMGGVAMTVVYICLSLYSRAVCRSRLAAEWDAAQGPGDRDEYIADGLTTYQSSLRRKLILGVYVVPVALVSLIIYMTNYH